MEPSSTILSVGTTLNCRTIIIVAIIHSCVHHHVQAAPTMLHPSTKGLRLAGGRGYRTIKLTSGSVPRSFRAGLLPPPAPALLRPDACRPHARTPPRAVRTAGGKVTSTKDDQRQPLATASSQHDPCQGIVGDRYAKAAGTYDVLLASSKTPGEREPGRSITLVSADDVEKALDAAGVQPLESIGDLRRNIVLRGISAKELLDAIGILPARPRLPAAAPRMDGY
eukprot:scaffold12181_cov213-Isochrysis_galbana.AAC.1